VEKSLPHLSETKIMEWLIPLKLWIGQVATKFFNVITQKLLAIAVSRPNHSPKETCHSKYRIDLSFAFTSKSHSFMCELVCTAH